MTKQHLISYFFMFGFLFFSRAFTPFFEALPGGLASTIFTPISLIIYLISFFLLLRSKVTLLNLVTMNMFPLLICFVAFLSSLYSFNMMASLQKSFALFGGLLFAAALVMSFNKTEAIDIFLKPIFLALLVSLFVSIFIPSIGLDDGLNDPDHLGLWQGVFGFKNNLGRTTTFFLLVIFSQYMLGLRYKWFVWLLPIFLLVMSKSTTPLIGLLTVMGLIVYLNSLNKVERGFKILSLPIFSLVIFISFFIIKYIIVDVFDKDLSGSGRTEMWIMILENIEFMWLGYGYGGVFWGEGRPADFLIGRLYFHLGHAHNGILDALIDMGVIGVVSYVLVLLVPFILAIKQIIKGNKQYIFTVCILCFLIIYSISGSSFLKPNNLLFILYCFSIFYPQWRMLNERNNDNC